MGAERRGDEDGTLMIHPGYQFGSVCCGRTRIPTDAVVSCIRGGDSVDAIAEGYGLTRLQVLTACWWEVFRLQEVAWSRRTKDQQRLVEAWGEWADEALMILGGHRRKDGTPPQMCPDPPRGRKIDEL